MPWKLWHRHGSPTAPSSPPSEPRVTVNRVHGYVSFNQAALSAMGLIEARVEILVDQESGLLGFRREQEGHGYILSGDRHLGVAKLLKELDAQPGKYAPTLKDGVWSIQCLPSKGRQE